MNKWQKEAEEIREFLQTEVNMMKEGSRIRGLTDEFFSLSDFIAQLGRPCEPAPFDADKFRSPCTIKECFSNVANLVLEHNELTYVEGYALGIIPVLHAWAINSNGKVVDPTWCGGNNPVIGVGYFGVLIKTSYLSHSLVTRKKFGIMDWWEDQWPILRADRDDYLEINHETQRQGDI